VAVGVEPGVRKHRRITRKLAVWSVGSEEVEAWWSMATHSWRKKQSRMEPYLASWVGGSRRKVLLHLQQKSVVRFLGSDGVALNGEPGGGHKCDRMGVRGRSSTGGGRERGENPTPPPSTLDKATLAWAATATGGDWVGGE
jgi:hypothetical protein